MRKYSQKLCDKITALVEEDNFTVSQICNIVNISRKAFYQWRATKADFAEALEQAVEAREERLKLKARQAIRKKIEGYKQIETKTTYVRSKDGDNPNGLDVKEIVVKEKNCMPDTRAIALSLSQDKKQTKESQSPTPQPAPLTIIVDNEKAKHELELLQENLRNEVF